MTTHFFPRICMKNLAAPATALVLLLLAAVVAPAQERVDLQKMDWSTFNSKTASPELMEQIHRFIAGNIGRMPGHTLGSPGEVKELIINGNKITTVVYNYGSITRPNTLGNVADLVWNRLGYGYEFAPLVAAEVINERGDTLRIVDDGVWLQSQGDYEPGTGLKWGWLPTPGYSAPGQRDIAHWSDRADVGGDLTRRPPSWPESWYNSAAGRYVWPAYLGNDATTPDEEVYFVMDDYTNKEFQYYPFPSDSSKRGLGLEMECRFFQFNNPLAEDIIFLVYRVTNKSPRTLRKVFFGMYGDPHVGGPNNFSDDLAGFYGPTDTSVSQRARNIVYAWDADGRGDGGLPTGYFGFKFLESPTNSTDAFDNDDDGIVDESPFNDAGFFIDGVNIPVTTGIQDTAKYRRLYGAPRPRWSGDENGNWVLERDDVGLDGLPGTGDFGEANGRPDVGTDANGNITAEPNFGIRDVNESDQIGLTSFSALPFGSPNYPLNDPLFYELLSTDSIRIDQELFNNAGDNIFVYGSGPFDLPPGGTQRFSIALLMGNNLADLILNSETAQRVLEANYQFAQPPPKPNVSVVPGDKRVTLYWDNAAEVSVDPLTGVNDFEGYKIYRSEDYTFSDVFTITDANGAPFLGRPFEQNGRPAQFDLVNQWSGLHPVEYIGRGVKYNVGSNSGLVHSYVDSSVTNGKTYYYAVVSYDRGFDSLGVQLPPTESQAAVVRDPVSGEFTFDANTAAVVPGPAPSGYTRASAGTDTRATQVGGIATGTVSVQILDERIVPDNTEYLVTFSQRNGAIVYNVEPQTTFTEEFTARDTFFVPLLRRNIIDSTAVVKNAGGAVVPRTDYFLDAKQGRIRGTRPGSLQSDRPYTITYRYNPVAESRSINNEDNNPTFDGMRVFARNTPLALDSLGSNWTINQNSTTLISKVHRPIALNAQPWVVVPRDFELRWNNTDTTANGKWAFPADTALTNNGRRIAVMPFKVVNITDTTSFRVFVNGANGDSLWKPGRELIVLNGSGAIQTHFGATFFRAASGPSRLPQQGDVFRVRTFKPFSPNDRYSFTSTSVKFDAAKAREKLSEIYVVPNPYVAYSALEAPGVTATKRGEEKIQFRNLPPRCTIRIYTMVGELVTTIEKDDGSSIADWNLLSNEGQRLAYGVYIFHVDVPEVGEKIGRFALIK